MFPMKVFFWTIFNPLHEMNVLITYDVKSTWAQHPFRELDGTLPLYESYLERPYDIVGRIVIFYQTFLVDFRMTSKYTGIDGY